MLPFEMFVLATPRSGQARQKKKRRDWREEIRAEAVNLQQPGDAPVAEPIRLKIGYYYRRGSLDLDNILKAMLDGLEGVVYTDDNLIIDLIVSKRSLDGLVGVNVSASFARALATGADFVHMVADRPVEIEVFR